MDSGDLTLNLNIFETRAEAAVAVALRIENALYRQLAAHDRAAIVVSGGTTPVPVFAHMAHSALDWHRVSVLLSDERWIPSDHKDSNENMLRDALKTSRASYAQIVPYFVPDVALDARCKQIDDIVADLPLPFSCTLLGMGEDGHFASLFPDSENLNEGLDLDNSNRCIAIKTHASAYDRISLTLSALTNSDEILLLISGEAKRALLEQASRKRTDIPVSYLLEQQRSPVQVFWAP